MNPPTDAQMHIGRQNSGLMWSGNL